MPNDIQTFANLKWYSQLYSYELEVDHEIDPDLPQSQPEVKQHHNDVNTKVAESGGMTMLDVGRWTSIR